MENFTQERIGSKDTYLVKILLVASKKAITRKGYKENLPTQRNWLERIAIYGEIYTYSKTGTENWNEKYEKVYCL